MLKHKPFLTILFSSMNLVLDYQLVPASLRLSKELDVNDMHVLNGDGPSIVKEIKSMVRKIYLVNIIIWTA